MGRGVADNLDPGSARSRFEGIAHIPGATRAGENLIQGGFFRGNSQFFEPFPNRHGWKHFEGMVQKARALGTKQFRSLGRIETCGQVAASASAGEDFSPRAWRLFKQKDLRAPHSGAPTEPKSRCPRAQNNDRGIEAFGL
jgi:hypothetical protein